MTKNILLAFFILLVQERSCFFVKIVNMTRCGESDEELGKLDAYITDKTRFDQEVTGKFYLPVNLDGEAILQYKASVLNEDNEWKILYNYKGTRFICNSVVPSLPYQDMAEKTSFPANCPIREGTYEFDDYPVSGQYVVFNTVRGARPLVKHRIRLRQDGLLILCRVFYTMSYDA